MSAERAALLRRYAKLRAEECVQDWAYEDRHENNDLWETDFTDEEMDEIVRLSLTAEVVIPE